MDQEISDKEFIVSHNFTIADIALANGLKWFGFEVLNDFPNITRYFKMHTQRPAFRKIVEQQEYPKGTAGA